MSQPQSQHDTSQSQLPNSLPTATSLEFQSQNGIDVTDSHTLCLIHSAIAQHSTLSEEMLIQIRRDGNLHHLQISSILPSGHSVYRVPQNLNGLRIEMQSDDQLNEVDDEEAVISSNIPCVTLGGDDDEEEEEVEGTTEGNVQNDVPSKLGNTLGDTLGG